MSVQVPTLRTDSPIEAAMAEALLTLFEKDHAEGPPDITIDSQVQLARYRADFLLTSFCPETWAGMPRDVMSRLVVECDGHDWHDRTPEQAKRDRKRDRFLLRGGFPVIRFTGSEINRDAISCAHDVFAALTSLDRLQAWGQV